MKRLVCLVPVFLIFILASSAQALPINNVVPSNAFINHNGLQWAWAAPCNPVDPSCGVIDLSFQGAFGWHIPTPAEFAVAPLATDFVFAGANVPLGGVDPVSGAVFAYGSPGGDAACASPYFSPFFSHCDWGNAPGSGGADPVPWGEDIGFVSYSEALVVRPIPEPGATVLFGMGLLVVGRALRRKA